MCILGLGGLAAGLTGGATAAGATAAAATGFSALQTFGTILSVGGTLLGAVQAQNAAQAQASAIEQQRMTERQLNATQDQRQRAQMMTAIRQQTAELAARGVQLDSPTAIALGQSAAQELSFDSQAIRSTGRARDTELSAEARMARLRGQQSLLRGTFSALGSWVDAAPDIWPQFARGGSMLR